MSTQPEFERTMDGINNLIREVEKNANPDYCNFSIAANIQSTNNVIRKLALERKISGTLSDVLSERLLGYARDFIINCSCDRRKM